MPIKVAFVITTGLKREEGSLMPILMFFTFVAVIVICTLALGYGFSVFEEQTVSRGCRIPHDVRHRRKARRQRTRCRFEGYPN